MTTTGPAQASLDLLVQLQDKDKAVDQLKSEIAELDRQIQIQKDLFNAEKERLAVAHQTGKQVALAKKAKELELAEKEAAVKKHQGELNAVKSNEAFKALQNEIDRAKADAGKIEDEILALMEQADSVVKAEKDEQVVIKKVEAETNAKIQVIEGRKKEILASAAATAGERDQTAAKLTPELVAKYEGIRARRKGLAVVPALKEGCGGCHMALPPQIQVEVRKGASLVACPNCQRILYVVPGPSGAPNAAPSAEPHTA